MTTCWECEAMTSQSLAATFAVPSGAVGSLELCPSCYRTCYLPLIAEASVDASRQDRLLPTRATPGARHSRR